MSYAEQQQIANVAEDLINPATEEKQDAGNVILDTLAKEAKQDTIIAAIDLLAKLTDTQPVIIKDSLGATWELEDNGAMPVNIQDQTTPPLILPMIEVLGTTTTTADTVVDANTITVTSAAGMTVGDHFRIINAAADRYYFGAITNIAGTTITVDTPFDFIYVSGSEVTYSNKNMAVDGSVTPVTFVLRSGSPSIPSAVDITRMIFICTTDKAVDLNKFGDIAGGLANGIVFRKVDGTKRNIFNVKTNYELTGLMYDFTVYQASNPSQGIDGFAGRLTFGGQSKIGVVLRLESDENLELIVQDDLSSLVDFEVILEGHVVQT